MRGVSFAISGVPLIVVVALKAMGEPLRPEDLWWHLAMGRRIAENYSIPAFDSFSFTRHGLPYFDQPWLAQLLLYGVYRAGGVVALLSLDFVLMLLAQALLVAAARTRGARIEALLLLQFALAPVAARGWAMRPQALAVPIFTAFVFVLSRWRTTGKGPLWILVPLMVAWANLHGSFPLGMGLILLTIAARILDARNARPVQAGEVPSFRAIRVDRAGAAIAFCSCMAAPLLNPKGPALFSYVVELVASPSARIAREWQAPGLADAEGIFIWFVLGMVVLLAIVRRPALGDLVLLIPFALLETMAVRNGIWLTSVLAPVLASWFLRTPSIERLPRKFVVVSACASAMMLTIPWFKPLVVPRPYGPLVWELRTPIAGVQALARDERRPLRLLHDVGFGSYLLWAFPAQQVFVDPRLELYPPSLLHDLADLGEGNRVEPLLAHYGIDGVLADKHRQSGLVRVLRRRDDFELRYEDDDCAYWVRRSS